MKNLRMVLALTGALSFVGAAALPAAAFDTDQVQAITADVVPTQQQVQDQLDDLHARLIAAEEAGSYNPTAESDYLAAQRMFEFGRYDTAARDANTATAALPPSPNWVTPTTASR